MDGNSEIGIVRPGKLRSRLGGRGDVTTLTAILKAAEDVISFSTVGEAAEEAIGGALFQRKGDGGLCRVILRPCIVECDEDGEPLPGWQDAIGRMP